MFFFDIQSGKNSIHRDQLSLTHACDWRFCVKGHLKPKLDQRNNSQGIHCKMIEKGKQTDSGVIVFKTSNLQGGGLKCWKKAVSDVLNLLSAVSSAACLWKSCVIILSCRQNRQNRKQQNRIKILLITTGIGNSRADTCA